MLIKRKISIAPMVDVTDEHFRYYIRLFSKKVHLYTPMISALSIIMGDLKKVVRQTKYDSPIALQIASDSEKDVDSAICILEKNFNFDEYNLNAGCPSSRVQNANYGACLMKDPLRVIKIIKAMQNATNKPISLKHRIGIRHNASDYSTENYEELKKFVDTILSSGIKNLIIHARIAILNGLSPKENRNIPRLRHEFVDRLKEEYKGLFIETNGGIRTSNDIEGHLKHVDSVMIGRAAVENPYFIAEASRKFLEESEEVPTREDILFSMVEYIKECNEHMSINVVLKHIMGLVFSKDNARKFRGALTPPFDKNLKNHEILLKAMETLPKAILKSNS